MQQTSEYSKKGSRLTDRGNKLVVTSGGRGRVMMGGEWEAQTTGCKTGYKNVLYDTKEYGQYFVIPVNGM